MSRTRRGSKGGGFDYWKSLHPKFACMKPGGSGSANSKKLTSRRSRRAQRQTKDKDVE